MGHQCSNYQNALLAVFQGHSQWAIHNPKCGARICSLHFRPEELELNVQRMRRATLKETAIPLDPVLGDEAGQAIFWTTACKMQSHRGKTAAIFDYTSVHRSFLIDRHKKAELVAVYFSAVLAGRPNVSFVIIVGHFLTKAN